MQLLHGLWALARLWFVVALAITGFVLTLPIVAILHRSNGPRVTAARLAGRVFKRSLAILGPTFVKIGQILGTRPDLLPLEMVEELSQLQEQMRPARFKRIRAVLEAELPLSIDHRFLAIDPCPVAVGSIAQVHLATLVDGTEVVLKVLRPGIRALISRDAQALRTLVDILAIFPGIRAHKPREHFDEFIAAITVQTDLSAELRNYSVFRANFRGSPDIVFPEVYPEHSTSQVPHHELLARN